MFRVTIFLGMAMATMGCRGGPFDRAFDVECPPSGCEECHLHASEHHATTPPLPAESPPVVVKAPQQEIEVETPTPVVVKAPQQEIIVESPPPVRVPVRHGGHHGAAHPGMHVAMAGNPPVVPPGYAAHAQAITPVRAKVRRKTRLGFKLSTFNIPIPFLKPIVVEEADEITYEVPVQQPAPPPVYPVLAPRMVAQAPALAPLAYPQPQSMVPVPYPGQVMMPQSPPMVPVQGMAMGQGQVVVSTQSAATPVASACAASVPSAAPACAPPAGNAAAYQAKLQQTQQQLQQLQQLYQELKQLKQQQSAPKNES